MSGRWRAVLSGWCFVVVLLAMGRFGVDRVDLDHDSVFRGDDDVVLLGGDGWFHVRHALHAAREWPTLIRFDAGAHYPEGLRTTHVGLWDLALGTAIRLGDAEADPVLARRIVVWAAPLVGALAVGLAAVVAFATLRRRRSWGPGVDHVDSLNTVDAMPGLIAAASAAWLLVLHPAHYGNAARLGEVDHHVVEPVLGWLSVLGIALATTVAHTRAKRAVLVVVGGLPLLAFVFTWAGAPLVLGLLAAGMIAALAIEVVRRPDDVDSGAERVAVGLFALALLCACVVIMVVWPWAPMEPMLRTVTPGIFAAVALAAMALQAVARSPRWRAASTRSRVIVLVAVAVMGIVGVWLWPTTARLLGLLFSARAETVAEHREVVLVDLIARHGLSAGFSLVAFGFGLVRVASGTRVSAASGAGVALVVGMVGLWVRVHDYGTWVAPLLAVTGGCGVGLVVERMLALSGRARLRLAALMVVVVALSSTAPRLTGRREVTLTPANAGRRVLFTPAWRDALDWLAQRSTSTSTSTWDITREFTTPPDMDLAGTPGVMAAWDHGHMVAAVAGLPTVADHGPSGAAAKVWTARDEHTALAALCPTCGPGEAVRFIIADVQGVHLGLNTNLALAGGQAATHTRRARVRVDSDRVVEVALLGGAATTFGQQLWSAPFGGHGRVRAVWQSMGESLATHQVELAGGQAASTPRVIPVTEATRASLLKLARPTTSQPHAIKVKDGLLVGGLLAPDITIFEVVRGALVDLQGPPGGLATVTLPLQTPHGPSSWQSTVTLDDEGRARVVVPYPTTAAAPCGRVGSVCATGPGTVRVGGAVMGSLVITARDVDEGLVVTPLP